MDENSQTDSPQREFRQLADEPEPGLLAEFWDFLIHNTKWWLLPNVIVRLLMGVLVLLRSSPVSPFIYTLW